MEAPGRQTLVGHAELFEQRPVQPRQGRLAREAPVQAVADALASAGQQDRQVREALLRPQDLEDLWLLYFLLDLERLWHLLIL